MKIGFLGMGIMGAPMAANLVRGGHDVTVWNRTANKCAPLAGLGAGQAMTAAEAVAASDVTIAMLADPHAAERVVFGDDGVLAGMTADKGYVDMSTVDESTSRHIGEAIAEAGGRFLEAPVSGSRKPAEDGTLIILCAGDQGLYGDLGPLLDLMGKKRMFLGQVGQAARMKLVVNMIMGGMMASFCEGLSLADRGGLELGGLLEVLAAGALANPMFAIKGPQIGKRDFEPAFPLKHMQKDLRLAGDLGDILAQSLPVAQAANGVFEEALGEGFGDEDFCAVYKTVRKD